MCGSLQEKTKIVTEIFVCVTEFVMEIMFSDRIFSVTILVVTKFCDGFLTDISQNIVMEIVSITKNSRVEKGASVTNL